MKSLIFISSLVLFINSFYQVRSFHYSQSGKDWIGTCKGNKQSPINIDKQNVKQKVYEKPFVMSNYDSVPDVMILENNGHSVSVKVEFTNKLLGKKLPKISGGPLDSPYILDHIHFHWSTDNHRGSEHLISGQSFTLEMHLVHYKKSYENLNKALDKQDGLAVVGYLYDLSPKFGSQGFEILTRHFSQIFYPEGPKRITEVFPLSALDLDLKDSGFYTYEGSLTTPPCTENVLWIVSPEIRKVTLKQMEAFRSIALKHKDTHNYRPVQELNGRTIIHVKEGIKKI